MCDILNSRVNQGHHLSILARQPTGSWPRAACPDRWTGDSPLQTSGDKFKLSLALLASFSAHLSLLYSWFNLAYQLALPWYEQIPFRMLSPLFSLAGSFLATLLWAGSQYFWETFHSFIHSSYAEWPSVLINNMFLQQSGTPFVLLLYILHVLHRYFQAINLYSASRTLKQWPSFLLSSILYYCPNNSIVLCIVVTCTLF